MEKLYISVLIGIAAATIDVIPMWFKKMGKYATLSAFIHYFMVSVVIVNIEIPTLAWWLKGGIVALAMAVPIMLIVAKRDRNALPIMAVMAVILGSLIGIAGHYLSPAKVHEEIQHDTAVLIEHLKLQADQWDRDIVDKRMAAVASNMSDDFRHIDKRGNVSDKTTFLRNIASEELIIHPYTVEGFNIRIYGNCALLQGTTRMNGTFQGQPFKSSYRYVDTYARIDGKWRVCQVQISPLTEQSGVSLQR